jgi:hypothetical protein
VNLDVSLTRHDKEITPMVQHDFDPYALLDVLRAGDDGAYLNVAHVRYQIEQFDTVLKVIVPARNEPLGSV